MFKCKECGTEYDIKPDFCDCGNDTFEEVATPVKEEIKQTSQSLNETPAVSHDFHKTQKNTDVASSLIFLFLVTLAIIVVFFIGNPKQENTNTKKPEETPKQVITLPSIDTLWNSSTIGIINNEKSKLNQVPQAAQQPVQQQPVQIAQSPVTVQKPQQAPAQVKQPEPQKQAQQTPKKTIANIFNTQPKQTTNTTNTSKATTTTKTAQTTTTTKPNIPPKTQAIANGQKTTAQKTTTQTTTKPTTTTQTQTKPAQTTTQSTTPKTTATQTSQTKSATNVQGTTTLRPKTQVDTQALKKELDNYKVGLRNTIGRKIDFANVIGDGDCTVSFKVAQNGKLTNRAFAKQSTNITLNDAVYSAVMSTPSYNPPPTGYNNETMNLHIKFYNGNFDISLN